MTQIARRRNYGSGIDAPAVVEHRGFSTEECQDLIQETFLRVYRGIGAFRGESRWEHWLFRIAANTAIKALRHRAAAKRAGAKPSVRHQSRYSAYSSAHET